MLLRIVIFSGLLGLLEGCSLENEFSSSCPSDAKIVPFTNKLIDSVLEVHNSYRNKIAAGEEEPFQSAVNMKVMTWDNQLAISAEINVKQCEMRHDDCFRSEKYPDAGQNLASAMSTSDYLDISFFINNSISNWYEEKSLTSPSVISKCCGGDNFSKIGHFLQMLNDNATTIGCAIAKFSDTKWKNLILACNYSFGNTLDAPVYRAGETASGCEFGRNLEYPALCN